jgi:hypothetical protein
VYMTFRDKRGKAWQRDTHGRLTPFQRNVDNAPPADPVSGRISYGTIQPNSRAHIVEVIIQRLIKEERLSRPAQNEKASSRSISASTSCSPAAPTKSLVRTL